MEKRGAASDTIGSVLTRLQQNPVKKAILVMVLPIVAGAVNGSGLFEVGAYTSHMTGNTARLGHELAQEHWGAALQLFSMIASFGTGAMVGAALVELSKRRNRARYALGLIVEAAVLSAVTAATLGSGDHFRLPGSELIALLCFAMGLQNAMITRLSGAVVRTTHVTGIVTDIGIELVHLYLWLRKRTSSWGQLFHWRTIKHLREDPELAQLRLHWTLWLSFVSGNVLGAVLYLNVGFASMLLPIIVVLGLTIFDLREGLDPPEKKVPLPVANPVDSGAHTFIPHHER